VLRLIQLLNRTSLKSRVLDNWQNKGLFKMAIAAGLIVFFSAWIVMFPLRVILFTTMTMLIPSSTAANLLSSSSSYVRGYSVRKLDGNSGDGGGRGLNRFFEEKISSKRILQKNAVFDDFCQEIEMEENNPFRAFLPDQFHQCLPMDNYLVQKCRI
jgi:hypothetical protein